MDTRHHQHTFIVNKMDCAGVRYLTLATQSTMEITCSMNSISHTFKQENVQKSYKVYLLTHTYNPHPAPNPPPPPHTKHTALTPLKSKKYDHPQLFSKMGPNLSMQQKVRQMSGRKPQNGCIRVTLCRHHPYLWLCHHTPV